jgi:hypothetical protein
MSAAVTEASFVETVMELNVLDALDTVVDPPVA